MEGNKNKERGTSHELGVARQLIDLGAHVAWPLGENCQWDLVCDFSGTVTRLQVKGTDAGVRGTYRVGLRRGKGSVGVSSYEPRDTDCIVACTPIGRYVIPLSDVKRDRLIVWDNGKYNRQPYYDRFREAWHLLKR